MRFALLLFLALVPSFCRAKTVTLTFKSDDTSYIITFDSAKISEAEIRTLIPLSPYVSAYSYYPNMENFSTANSTDSHGVDKFLTALPLELCLDRQPLYTDCANNSYSSPNFFRNASVNLEKSRNGLAWLQALPHPKELQPVIDYLVRHLSFSLWMEETRFRYYSTWDVTVLKQKPAGFDAAPSCSAVFHALEGKSKEEQFDIVWHDWQNCVLDAARPKMGIYPMDSWNSFLRSFDIKEKYEEGFPD